MKLGTMSWMKDIMLEAVRRRSEREAAHLAGEFARAASEEREAILAALEFESHQLAEMGRPVLRFPVGPTSILTRRSR